jgi:hypothetical protein
VRVHAAITAVTRARTTAARATRPARGASARAPAAHVSRKPSYGPRNVGSGWVMRGHDRLRPGQPLAAMYWRPRSSGYAPREPLGMVLPVGYPQPDRAMPASRQV